MSIESLRVQLKSILEDNVSDIGEVYEYKRYSADWASYKKLFVKGTKVNEWEIQREGFEVMPRGSQGTQGKVKDITHNMVLRGFYGFKDYPSSEKAFDTLIDSITDLFISKPDFEGEIEIIGIPVVGSIFFGTLGDVVCHVVEISFTAREREFL